MVKLEVNHLSISFRTNNGAVRAVRDVSFTLNEGETLAIAGESGSGKSVTTRAIMGILAGNAMVDSGEIIYDGKDLLKIPEEEFHTLRGHRLAMVFQDPLSALNPIMRTGEQLTEAMILNNQERRADGEKHFQKTLSLLDCMLDEALPGSSAQEIASAHQRLSDFRQTVLKSVKLENQYQTCVETIAQAEDAIAETEDSLLLDGIRKVQEMFGHLSDILGRASDEWVFRGERGVPAEAQEQVKRFARGYKASQKEDAKRLLANLRSWIKNTLSREKPDFFAIGYMEFKGESLDAGAENEAIRRGRQLLEANLLRGFRSDVEKVLQLSEKRSLQEKANALSVLQEKLPVFQCEKLDRHACEEALRECEAAVQKAIDPLELVKDNPSYVFAGSMRGYLERYFTSLSHNPKEERRFRKEQLEHDRLEKMGKHAASVVPLNLIDTESARSSLGNTVEALSVHLREIVDAGPQQDVDERAGKLTEYLRSCASDSVYHLSKGMAKHRAIELLKEVGISEPYKRYDQYPFSMSGGMRQRIVIAIALSANPDILICDEPTTALDVTIQAQILELINRLKRERRLSVIFITHDLGVVANMADRIAIMYAGKIVEYGTADEVFYDPRHPYTWALLSSMPDLETREKLDAIPGTPPNMILPPQGDAFAARNRYAMEIDLEQQPPMFSVSDTHWAATWLLHPNAPKVDPPAIVTERIQRMKRRVSQNEAVGGDKA